MENKMYTQEEVIEMLQALADDFWQIAADAEYEGDNTSDYEECSEFMGTSRAFRDASGAVIDLINELKTEDCRVNEAEEQEEEDKEEGDIPMVIVTLKKYTENKLDLKHTLGAYTEEETQVIKEKLLEAGYKDAYDAETNEEYYIKYHPDGLHIDAVFFREIDTMPVNTLLARIS